MYYKSKVSIKAQNDYLYYLVRASTQRVNRLFVLSSESNPGRTVHTVYYLPKAEVKYYHVMLLVYFFLSGS